MRSAARRAAKSLPVGEGWTASGVVGKVVETVLPAMETRPLASIAMEETLS